MYTSRYVLHIKGILFSREIMDPSKKPLYQQAEHRHTHTGWVLFYQSNAPLFIHFHIIPCEIHCLSCHHQFAWNYIDFIIRIHVQYTYIADLNGSVDITPEIERIITLGCN